MVGDPIGDMFSRINNAGRAKKSVVAVPYSKIKMEIAKLLEKRGLAGEAARKGKKNRRAIELPLFYDESGSGKITEIKRVSKPSRRIYKGWRELKPVKGGTGLYIISTPFGIIDDKQARKLKVGGEILGEAW
ncbi:MAG: 30S ribosomal protein S8 [Candidatus Niyogibacteria bacterium]|nr:MAG: 30S ribosomal protein S8 [Candidatus Niyogibacteria bacterium]